MADDATQRLLGLRLHQADGQRSPHKPLLALLALQRLDASGSSAWRWSELEPRLADLLAEFGRPTSTGRAQSAAYPFTRLRSDGIWQLDADVPMDAVGPLRAHDPVGRFSEDVERALTAEPGRVLEAARSLAASHFPESLLPDVLSAVGFDVEAALGVVTLVADSRRRSSAWRAAVIEAWDRSCAFCGYDGQLGGAPVGLEAAHVRWFSHGGPDDLDNGLALCSLHHKLFDRGALGLTDDLTVRVSAAYTARTPLGRALYDLHDRPLQPRPGTAVPRAAHVAWHAREVFRGTALAA